MTHGSIEPRLLDEERRLARYTGTIPPSSRLLVTFPPIDSPRWHGPLRAFAWGLSAISQTILTVVLFVTYLGIGALAHDTHFSHRFLPHVPRERRIAFVHGLGCGLVSVCLCANTIGYFLAANLTKTLGAAILLLTPLSFLFSTARNSRALVDVVALALGLLLYPLAAEINSGLDILVSGVAAGTIAYGVHRLRKVRA